MNTSNDLKEAYCKIYTHIKSDFPHLRKRLRDCNWHGCSENPYAADITILLAGSIPSPDEASEYDMGIIMGEVGGGFLECYSNDFVEGTHVKELTQRFACGKSDNKTSFATCVDEVKKKPLAYWYYTLAHISKQEMLRYS
jgi:hypothetical protein